MLDSKKKKRIKLIMEKYIFAFLIMWALGTHRLSAQGGWSIRYILPSLLDTTFINREVKIDFKSSNKYVQVFEKEILKDKKYNSFLLRFCLMSNDTVNLKLDDGKPFKMVEHWTLHDDMGLLSSQYMELVSNNSEKKYIKKMIILSIDEKDLVLKLYLYDTFNNNENYLEQLIRINKSYINVILYYP